MSKLYEVLLLINNSEKVSQRYLAEKLDISLGKINAIVKNLEEQEYIVKSSADRGYSLTNSGIDVLQKYIAEGQRQRIAIDGVNKKREVTQTVILAAGEKDVFKKPVSFLNMGKERIIDRILRLLNEAGIEEIIVVAGYEKQYFYELQKNNPKIKIVENNRYKYTGTMHSLSLCKDEIKSDFILLENDMIFEERAVFDIIKDSNATSMLITSQSGSGDEALVELKDNMVYKMSKDVHQLNHIDGEMIGISKIGKEFFEKMLEVYSTNKNPYVNYEYVIMDVGREFRVGYLKLDDLMWFEIDNESHLKKAKGSVYSSIIRREQSIRIENLKAEIMKGLNVSENDIESIEHAGGMTNKNYKVRVLGQDYILRVAGAGTQDMISRKNEKNNARIGNVLGLDTEIAYFDEESGIKISRYIDGAETLNPQTAKYEENMEMVATVLKKLHFSCLDFENTFDVFREIEKYEKLVEDANGTYYDDEYEAVREKVMALEDELNRIGRDSYTCHNDTVAENFIKDKDGRLYLIDWEYSGMNDPMWDVSAFILETELNEDEEVLFKSKYFSIDNDLKAGSDTASDIQEEKILLFKICQDFLWSIWTVLKEAKGVDFGDYGPMRYNRAKKFLDEFYARYM